MSMNRLIRSSSPQTSYTEVFDSTVVCQKLSVVYVFFLIALSYTPVAAMCFLPKHLGKFDRLSCVRTYAVLRTATFDTF